MLLSVNYRQYEIKLKYLRRQDYDVVRLRLLFFFHTTDPVVAHQRQSELSAAVTTPRE